MQDNIYLWRPEGVEESAVQDAAFEALQGDWGAGLAKLEDEVRAAPNNTEALNYLATALLSQPTPDTTRASELLERAVECEPGNLALSMERARVVRQALIERGIPRDGLRASGVGSSQPVEGLAPSDPANRRIEFSVIRTEPLRPTPVDTPGAR